MTHEGNCNCNQVLNFYTENAIVTLKHFLTQKYKLIVIVFIWVFVKVSQKLVYIPYDGTKYGTVDNYILS